MQKFCISFFLVSCAISPIFIAISLILSNFRRLEFPYFSSGTLQTDVQNQADAAVKTQQGADSVTDKGQRESCVGKDPRRHRDVGKPLEGDQNAHAGADHFSFQVGGFSGKIQAFIDNTDVKADELFFLNKDCHILMNRQLTFLFLCFAQPELTAYFNGLLGELMADGMVFSDSFILSLASDRVPTKYLQQIINDREHATSK